MKLDAQITIASLSINTVFVFSTERQIYIYIILWLIFKHDEQANLFHSTAEEN